MTLPPLYKYLNVKGANLTLGNQTFKHAKPSDFNDTEDLTVRSIFSEEIEAALKAIERGLPDVIFRHINQEPTCSPSMKQQVATLQNLFRNKPGLVKVIKAGMAGNGGKSAYNIGEMRQLAEEFVVWINGFLQGFRVLCVTTELYSEKMWSEYAENHRGIVLRLEPNLEEDSKFQRFRPVIYRERRPPLYENTLDFLAESLFGDQEARGAAMMERIVYSKTLEWQHESEYRLVIPTQESEAPWDTLPYFPSEISELYLGLAMKESDMADIVGMALSVNPKIRIFSAERVENEQLEFAPFRGRRIFTGIIPSPRSSF